MKEIVLVEQKVKDTPAAEYTFCPHLYWTKDVVYIYILFCVYCFD